MIDLVAGVSSGASISKQREQTKDARVKEKKKHFLSQIEGKYYCTYLINACGQKILLSKVLLDKVSERDIEEDDSVFDIVVKSL